MKTARTLTFTFALLTYGAIAIAADSTRQVIRREAPKGITTTFYTCIDKAGSDTIAIGACLSTEKTTQDARLNTTYKALLGKLHHKGWITGALVDPPALHLMLTPVHLQASEVYLADLEAALTEVGGSATTAKSVYAG